MKYCTKCGKQLMDDAVVCTGCGCATDNANKNFSSTPKEVDAVDGGLNVLALLFPIVGLIMFCVMYNKTPIKAKSIGVCALAGFIFGVVLMSILFAL